MIAEVFGATPPEIDLGQSYNVAPTQDIYGVVAHPDLGRRVEVFRWGLVPSWSRDASGAARMINARAETVGEKRSFAPLLARRRVVIPMDGFYEWAPRDDAAGPKRAKQPVFIRPARGGLLSVAGLWTAWRDPQRGADDGWLHTCTVVTTAANDALRAIHDRMPAVLAPDACDRWLDPDLDDPVEVAGLLRPASDDVLEFYPVSTLVNRVGNNSAELIEPTGTP